MIDLSTPYFLATFDTGGHHHPRDPYVEFDWLPVVGPSVYCLARNLALRVAAGEEKVVLADVAREIGLFGVSGLKGMCRVIERAEKFRAVRLDGWTIAVNVGWRDRVGKVGA